MPESSPSELASSPPPAPRDRRFCVACDHDLQVSAGASGDLVGEAGRCPECGLDFDVANPRTWRRGRRSGFERRFGACGPIFGGFALIPVLLLSFANSAPAVYFGWAMLAVLLLSAYTLAWLVRFATRIGSRWRLGGPGPIAAREWWWLVGPTVIALGLAIVSTPVPVRVGFALAQRDLERIREEFGAGTLAPPATAGWYEIGKGTRSFLIIESQVFRDGREGMAIVNVIDESELSADPDLAARVRAAVEDPSALVRPGSMLSKGQRVVESIRFAIEDSGFLDAGFWGWIEDGPAELRGFDMSWRRVSGHWYAMRETW
ncbi:MAG: hypothetical protein ACO3P9_13280 [Phycisphaerales bacterium]